MEPKRELAEDLREAPRGGPRPIPQNQPPGRARAEGAGHFAERLSPEESTKRGVKVGWRRSPAFWWVTAGSVLFVVLATAYFFLDPQVGWVLLGVGIAGLAVAAAVAGMVTLRSRRRRDERLRSAP